VTADLDFSQVEKTSETYKPNQNAGTASIRSQQISETNASSEQKASGVPGSLSNQPPAPVSAPVAQTLPSKPTSTSGNTTNTQRDSTTNYELDKTIQHVKDPVGSIKRLSVAVVVNYRRVVDANKKVSMKPLPPAEISQITSLVKDTMGFNAARGDTLNIVNTAFTSTEEEAIPAIPWWKQPEIISLITAIAKNLAIAAVVGYLIFWVIRPAMKNVRFQASRMAEAEASAAAEKERHVPIMSKNDAESAEAARELARQNPQLVANVIKGWVAGNE
ncbi:MAG TPA: flagellar basal-body MS-ring/collar protein FliF, partial [Burkholderiales bacterium]|nr:flagellar basal-body MS-ring/collar protein FliF [Burkholderiales bacterium]